MKLAEEVGNRLRGLREKKGITQRELARQLDMPFQSLSNYERGYRQGDYETLKLFSDYYNVSVDYLIRGTNSSDEFQAKTAYDIEELINRFTILLDNKQIHPKEFDELVIYLRSRRIMEQLRSN